MGFSQRSSGGRPLARAAMARLGNVAVAAALATAPILVLIGHLTARSASDRAAPPVQVKGISASAER